MTTNRQILLDNRPTGEASESNFRLVSTDIAPLNEGEVLVRHHYLSLDPYMRGRMNDIKSYAQPQALGQVMIGGTVGEIVQSRHPKFAVGDSVVGMGGWQELAVVDVSRPGQLRRVDDARVPLSAWLGPVGMPGVTAWVGLNKFIEPKAGYPIYRLKLARLEELGPGMAPGLDVICNGILEHTPFVMGETGTASVRSAHTPAAVAPSPS